MSTPVTGAEPGALPASAPEGTAPPAAPAAPADDVVARAIQMMRGEDPNATATPPAAVPPPAPVVPPKPPDVAPGAELALVARSKAELGQAQAAFAADRAKWAEQQRDALARVEAFERAQAAFDANPAAFVKALGSKRTFEEIARAIFEHEHTEHLTPDQKALREVQAKVDAAERRAADVEKKFAAEQNERLLSGYRSTLAADLGTLTDETPLVKHMAAKKPQVLLNQMMQLANHFAANEPQRGVQTAAQLAAFIEEALAADLEPYHPYFESKYKVAPPAAAPPAPQRAPGTLGDAHTGRTTPPGAEMSDEEAIEAGKRLLRAARA